MTNPHGGDQGQDQGRGIQVSGGKDQGWELGQAPDRLVWRHGRVRML